MEENRRVHSEGMPPEEWEVFSERERMKEKRQSENCVCVNICLTALVC